MSNQVYSVPYGTVQLHDPTGLVRGGSTSNSNTNSAASGSHSNLGQSPTPSIEQQQQQHHQHRHQQQHYQDQDQEEAEIDQDLEDDEVDLEPEDDPQDGEYDNSIESQQAAASGGRSRRKGSVGAKKSGGGGKRAGSVTARKEKGLGRNGTPIGGLSEHDEITGRRKIKIQFVEDDNRRHVTFSKRKAGIMKKAYELATLTGTQVLLLIVSQTDQVFTFATPKLQRIVMETEGQVLIQNCLQAPDDDVPGVKRESGSETQGGQDDGEVEQESQLGVGGIGSQEELGSEYLRMNDEDEGSRGEAGRETSSPVPPPHKNSPKKANFNARIKTPKVPKAPKVPKPKKLTKTQLLALAQAQAQAQQVEIERLERERIERERIENERANGTLSDPPPMIGRDRALTGGAIGSARDADEFNRPHKRSRDEMNEMVGGIGGHGHPYGSRENSSNVSLDLNLHSAGDGLEGYWNNAGGSGASGSGNSNGNAGVHQDHLSNSHSGNPNSQHQLTQLSHSHQHYQRPHSHSLSSVNPYQQQQQHLTGNHQSQFSSPQLSTSSSPIVSNHHWNGSNQTGPNGMGLNHPTLLNRNQGTMFGNGNGNGNQGDINVNVGAGYNGGNGSSGGDYGGWGA